MPPKREGFVKRRPWPLAAAVLTSVVAAVTAQPSTEAVLVELEHRLAKAWVARERDFIDGLLADDWSVTDAAGRVLTKQQALDETFASPDRRIDSMAIDDLRVRVLGDVAIVTGRTTASGSYRGQTGTAVLRFTDVFVRRDGRWQCVASHGSSVAP
jgi:ketosteroid isomerase-like protein